MNLLIQLNDRFHLNFVEDKYLFNFLKKRYNEIDSTSV